MKDIKKNNNVEELNDDDLEGAAGGAAGLGRGNKNRPGTGKSNSEIEGNQQDDN